MDTFKILGLVFFCVSGFAALFGVATCVYKKKCCFQKTPEEVVYQDGPTEQQLLQPTTEVSA
jgi:hypothetical protein